ncbi:MAG: CorA family divalent cation transporter [Alphaproteobacteria bacterium]
MAQTSFAVILDKKGGAQKVPLQKKLMREKKPLWIHLEGDAADWLTPYKNQKEMVPIVEHLLAQETTPRCVRYKNGLMITLRGLNVNNQADDDMVAVHIWLSKTHLITVAAQPVAAVAEVLELLRRKKGPHTIPACFTLLARQMIQKIKASLADIAEQADDLEDRVIEETGILQDKQLREDLAHLRHLIVSFRRFLAPQQGIMEHLEKMVLFGEEDKVHLHTLSRDLGMAVEKLNFARDHSSVTQDQLDAKTNTNISQIMYLMSMIMVIFTPLSFITGLLGANIGGIPFGENPYGFLVICLILAVILICQISVIKKMHWF